MSSNSNSTEQQSKTDHDVKLQIFDNNTPECPSIAIAVSCNDLTLDKTSENSNHSSELSLESVSSSPFSEHEPHELGSAVGKLDRTIENNAKCLETPVKESKSDRCEKEIAGREDHNVLLDRASQRKYDVPETSFKEEIEEGKGHTEGGVDTVKSYICKEENIVESYHTEDSADTVKSDVSKEENIVESLASARIDKNYVEKKPTTTYPVAPDGVHKCLYENCNYITDERAKLFGHLFAHK